MVKTKGYTYIELSIVLVMLVLISATVLPNFVNRKRSESLRNFRTSVRSIATKAKNAAVQQNKKMILEFNGETALRVRADAASANDADVASLTLPEGITGKDFVTPQGTKTLSDWQIGFYTDGSSDQGGVEFEVDKETFALNIDARGNTKLEETLTDTASQSWSGGNLATRS